jgi:DNA-binding NarL/FixJ family response regulator
MRQKQVKKKKWRVLIVDDHPSVREALALRIGRQADLQVCGEAADASEALRLAADTRPDVIVVDISLKSSNGIDLIKRIKAHDNKVGILVWSMHSERLYAQRAMQAGALGYVNKDQATDKIVEAIRRVLEGKVYLSEAMAEKLLHHAVGAGKKAAARSPVDALADRELDVFRMIGEGLKTTEIAERLRLSIKTVETYRDRIRHKLDLSNGTELVHYATRWIVENG